MQIPSSSRSSNKMPSSNQPGFLKVLIDDFYTELLIPVAFTGRYGELLHGTRLVNLKTQSGKCWTVETEKIDEMHCYFIQGWAEFVNGNQLEELDYLTFELVGTSTFEVTIFGMNGCEKGTAAATPATVAISSDTLPMFTVQLQERNRYYLRFPVNFAVQAGLAETTKITLRDLRGLEWPVEICHYRKLSNFSYISEARNGWNEFVRAQKLNVGSVVSLELVPGSKGTVLQVKVLESGQGRGNPFQPRCPVGRPRGK